MKNDQKFTCERCGNESETLVNDIKDGSQGCWPCVAGPDQMMLRRVCITFEDGRVETRFVHAENNLRAFDMVGGVRRGVIKMIADPMPN
jgi:hypothetical protein